MPVAPWTSAGVNTRLKLLYGHGGKSVKLNIYVLLVEDGSGRPCEIAVKADSVGSTIRGLLDVLGSTATLALERGAPIHSIIDAWARTRFEPSGRLLTHPEIGHVGSIADTVAQWLLHRYPPPPP